MKNNRLNLILYIIASLMIFIPAAIVFVTGNGLNPFQSKMSIFIALIFIIVTKKIT